ncbi:MAG TPA: hypothetical protein VEK07_05745 [Polyangiaceae bacterium]|nr:hypothetical protein [Polyangiaceae bacterium]
MSFLSPIACPRLVGTWTVQSVTLMLARDEVKWMLPEGLELGSAKATEPGKHPVILYFGSMFGARLSVGPFPPTTNYLEHVVGVPYVFYKRGRGKRCGYRGPFYYMPQLFLDDLLFTVVGVLVWGFNKARANFMRETQRSMEASDHSYTVSSRQSNQKLVELNWHADGPKARVENNKAFELQRQIMNHPVISRQPLAIGPFFSCSNYDKTWSEAEVRPIQTQTSIHCLYVPGLAPADYNGAGITEANPFGSFELQTRWSLTFPYECGCARNTE